MVLEQECVSRNVTTARRPRAAASREEMRGLVLRRGVGCDADTSSRIPARTPRRCCAASPRPGTSPTTTSAARRRLRTGCGARAARQIERAARRLDGRISRDPEDWLRVAPYLHQAVGVLAPLLHAAVQRAQRQVAVPLPRHVVVRRDARSCTAGGTSSRSATRRPASSSTGLARGAGSESPASWASGCGPACAGPREWTAGCATWRGRASE